MLVYIIMHVLVMHTYHYDKTNHYDNTLVRAVDIESRHAYVYSVTETCSSNGVPYVLYYWLVYHGMVTIYTTKPACLI